MRLSARRDRIVELLLEHGRLTVEELAHRLGASQETIRRDLTELAMRNQLRKFHGGAALPDTIGEGAFRLRMVERLESKRSIARCAAPLFPAGSSLFIDTGSTTIALAAELAQRSGLSVITNSVAIAQLVSRSGANTTYLLGGEHRHEAGENLGPLAVRQIEGFFPEHAVLTVGGITEDGIADFDLQEAEIARAMIARAARITVVADASKFGKPALFHLCPLPRLDQLVTDAPPPEHLAAALEAAGTTVLVARNWQTTG
ncbi:DeoR/GlpR family DNA-binding transcription regulator [Pseudoroseomonas globiformis]|uniref:DeoR/GlpR family DNA-binding transcription regulator n=1 Tax=Teichococcus globiformis TaxID=2307229 RepID=A0ABV7G5A3_9PROT